MDQCLEEVYVKTKPIGLNVFTDYIATSYFGPQGLSDFVVNTSKYRFHVHKAVLSIHVRLSALSINKWA